MTILEPPAESTGEFSYADLMLGAYMSATRSPDPSTQNGAILVSGPEWGVEWTEGDPTGPMVAGCNEFPDGISDVHWSGPKQGKYDRVVHAEVSALLAAACVGMPTMASTLICPWAACSNCAKHIAYAGVATLVRHKFSNNGVTTGNHWYDDCVLGDEIMREAGVRIVEIEPVSGTGVEIRRDGKIWTP